MSLSEKWDNWFWIKRIIEEPFFLNQQIEGRNVEHFKQDEGMQIENRKGNRQ